MTNDWLVTIRFNDMPEDADADSMRTFAETITGSIMDADVEFQIVKIERVQE
jgi:hypothetical protein